MKKGFKLVTMLMAMIMLLAACTNPEEVLKEDEIKSTDTQTANPESDEMNKK